MKNGNVRSTGETERWYLMKLLILLVIIGISIVICKVVSLGIVLLFIAQKNIKFKKNTNQWEQWFTAITDKKLMLYTVCLYLTALSIVSVITYYIFLLFKFNHAFVITFLFFIIRFVISVYRYKNRKVDLLKKLKKLSN